MKTFSRLILAFVLFFSFSLIQAEVVNVNEANAGALEHYLTGIGPVKAATIVEYRTEHGNFKTVDDLAAVPGIGNKTIEANRENLSVSEGVTARVSVKDGS